ncbi:MULTISPECIES: hypothetical protein [Henriciella]|jgi:hypothetical protein|uniref:hypothetical protein n=1 Tax=Henriciella TaxID=453849 RepID=UPI0035129A8A
MAERDIEREEEVSRQRGYGEEFRKGKELENQSTSTAGYKDGAPVAAQAGADSDLVTNMQDERVPNAPNDGTDDDSSAEIEARAALKKKPDGHILEDAYSVPDPGVETKQ